LLLVFACGDNQSAEKPVVLETFKDKLSYSLGADHARAISESGDPYFAKYDIEQMVKGFKSGLKDENAFDASCKDLMQKLYGANGQQFDSTYAKAGSECLGKLSGVIFMTSWKKKQAMDRMDLDKVAIGFKHGLLKTDTIIDAMEQGSMIQTFIEDLNKLNGNKLIEKAKQLPNTQATASGLVLETLVAGKGGSPAPGDDVLAHYILMNSLGDTLQSSFDMVTKYNQPLRAFSLAQVVPGWQEAMPMMQKGGKYRLYLPYHLGYGEQGMRNQQTGSYDIQPYETLKFYIELINYGKPGSLTKE
jgi:FKBP-type peptidyl-prolyl cis-trans isomerase FkpA